MTRRAIGSFREQTYQNRVLLVYDSGEAHPELCRGGTPMEWYVPTVRDNRSIGELRNHAIQMVSAADIIVTWDSDDASHPNRIAEQVAHLQASGADVVGYSELLFWRTFPHREEKYGASGEAWIYKSMTSNSAPGTSLCYKRSFWEQHPFADLPKNNQGTGEDVEFLKGAKVSTVSSIVDGEPRLVASIHGGNSMSYDIEAQIARGADRSWLRAPEFDSYCRERMAL